VTTSRTIELIERLGLLLRTHTRQRAAAHGLQPVHVQALDYLARCNRYSNTPLAVARYLHATKGTVSQSLRLLEQRRLLRRNPDPGDRRVVHLRLTARGRKVLGQCRTPGEGGNSGKDSEAASDDELIERGLDRLLRTLQAENGFRTFGQCCTCRHLVRETEQMRCGLTGERLRPEETTQICHEHAVPESAPVAVL